MLPRFRLPCRIAPPPAAASARPPDATAGRYFFSLITGPLDRGEAKARTHCFWPRPEYEIDNRRQDNVNSALIIVAPRWHSLGLFAAAAADYFAYSRRLRFWSESPVCGLSHEGARYSNRTKCN